MNHAYKNPWAKSHEPQEYVRNVEPYAHAGCQIFHVYPQQWDVVKGGVCIAQRTGRGGAEYVAELVSDLMFPTYQDVRDRHDAELEKSDGQ